MWRHNAVSIPLFLLQLTPSFATAQNYSACKASPGSPSWPSPLDWYALGLKLSGQLLKPTPPGAVCHPELPEYNNATCTTVLEEWYKVDYYATDPISSPWSNWNNDSCLPWTGAPCTGEGFPVYVVNATSKKDVKTGVDFARNHNVRLVVKGTGHDYLGRSTAPNSLSIWTHSMQGINFTKDFKPEGCDFSIPGDAVTAAAGVLNGDIDAAAATRNLTIVSGGQYSVGPGGYLQGGGHSIMGPTYGMGADQVLQMEVVTPSGEILTVNECQNQDLFWALRGGGGSTFGIMTSVTIKAFPSTPIITLSFLLSGPADSDTFYDGMTYLLSQYPALADVGIASYGSITANNSASSPVGLFEGVFLIPAISAANTSDSLAAALNPIFEHINTTWPGQFNYGSSAKTYPQFNDFFLYINGPLWAGVNLRLGSRLLDAEALTGPGLKKGLQGAMPSGGLQVYLVSGKGVANAVPRGGSNAVNPAWRKSLIHTVLGENWPYNDPTDEAATEDLITNTYVQALRDLAPNSGAYINEADPDEPNPHQAFWGDNYERLLEIKRKVDPTDVLWCTPCVGNERWKQVEDQLCRV